MSESIQTRATTPEPKNALAAMPAGARIDAAHVLGSGSAAPADQTAPVAADTPPTEVVVPSAPALELLSQMRTQGRQLAQLLHQRQQDLDRRESQQHAHAAELEIQRRAAEVWLSARHHELAEREEQLAAREREAADATSRVSAAESYLDAARREFETDLKRRENELVRDRQELERKRERLECQATAQRAAQHDFEERRQREHDFLVRSRQQTEQQRATSADVARQALVALEKRRVAIEHEAVTVERRRAELAEIARRPSPEQIRMARASAELSERLAAREEQLTQAEQLQTLAEAELLAIRSDLDAEREQLAQDARTERRRQVEHERQASAEVAEQREGLRRQRLQLDERQVTLERMRAELSELHQSALESRLVAEETLVLLAGVAASADVGRSLAETRARLADHWRLAVGRVADEKDSLARMSAEVDLQAKKLAAQRDEMSGWVERRQAEFDRQSAVLAEREEELRQLERVHRNQREEWDRHRLAFEQQLRQAMKRLRDENQINRASA
ncbi:MAG TPA: hypothetical protein VGN12_09365 [Pirellulales bacterium]|jgi:hypothetical protein